MVDHGHGEGDGVDVKARSCAVYKLYEMAGPTRRTEVIRTT